MFATGGQASCAWLTYWRTLCSIPWVEKCVAAWRYSWQLGCTSKALQWMGKPWDICCIISADSVQSFHPKKDPLLRLLNILPHAKCHKVLILWEEESYLAKKSDASAGDRWLARSKQSKFAGLLSRHLRTVCDASALWPSKKDRQKLC